MHNHLTIEGLAGGAPRQLSQADLAACPASFQVEDLRALLPRRSGKAVRFTALLAGGSLAEGAAWVELQSDDGAFVASLPLADILEDGLVQYEGVDGPLSPQEGGPFRLFIPGYGDACANVKSLGRVAFLLHAGRDNRPSNERQHRDHHAQTGGHDGHACKHDGPIS